MDSHKPHTEKINRPSVIAWSFYDWANSAFSTVVITFVFSVYFAQSVVGDDVRGSALWGYAIGLSGLCIVLLSPVLGAVADHYGARKRWLLFFSILCITATACLWFSPPAADQLTILRVLALVALANIGFELSWVFYNAMLPHIAPPDKIGLISGRAWGMGYAGGLTCLALVLFMLVGLGDVAPLLDLPRDHAEHVRAGVLLAALWFFLFMLPLLFLTDDNTRTGRSMAEAVSLGLGQLKTTLVNIRRHANLARYLVASALYRDGLNTLFVMGGIYAAGTFGMALHEVLIFAIGLNVTAGTGAALFALMDHKSGSRRTILVSLVALMILGTGILLVDDKMLFIVMALALGLFIGPVQAASRTMAARLSPPDMAAQTFGLYAFTGKSISFIGPLMFGLAVDIFGTQRAGMATILLFWALGAGLMIKVREPD